MLLASILIDFRKIRCGFTRQFAAGKKLTKEKQMIVL